MMVLVLVLLLAIENKKRQPLAAQASPQRAAQLRSSATVAAEGLGPEW